MITIIETVPHVEQRYPTLGDWFVDKTGDRRIVVSDLGDWRLNFLVAFHEQIEAALCEVAGIAEVDVMQFDIDNPDLTDPGADLKAPYHLQHVQAEVMERQMALLLGVEWADYEAACDEVMP